MLKIKDEVNLKELEKFGFEKYIIASKTKYEFVKRIGKVEIYNIKIGNDRIIHFNQLSVHNELPDTIYDLIQAGLVKKVEDK